jgi:hypothetical protein
MIIKPVVPIANLNTYLSPTIKKQHEKMFRISSELANCVFYLKLLLQNAFSCCSVRFAKVG